MNEHLTEELASGVQVRTISRKKDFPEDMSLIWAPLPPGALLDDLSQARDPIAVLRKLNVKPICGLKFATRQGHSLDGVQICSPGSTVFEQLEQDFTDAWPKATG